MIKGFLSAPGSEVDPYHTQDIKNFLYKVSEKKLQNFEIVFMVHYWASLWYFKMSKIRIANENKD